jgi:hypothetical protein
VVNLGAMRLIAVTTTVAAVTFAAAPSCASQVRVEVTPFVGYYVPTQYVASSSTGFTLRQRAGLMPGATVTMWFTRWLGIEASVGYWETGASYPTYFFGPCAIGDNWEAHPVLLARRAARPLFQTECGSPFSEPVPGAGDVTIFSARALLNVPLARNTAVYFMVGPATVRHGGYTGFNQMEDYGGPGSPYAVLSAATASIGVVAGVGMRVRVPGTPLNVRAEAGDYHYSVTMNLPEEFFGAQRPETQNDLVISLGLSVALRGRPW